MMDDHQISSRRMPKYVAIAATLREEIHAGRYPERIPTETALTERFGVARMTARHALQTLRDEGLITSVHGKGVFVTVSPQQGSLVSVAALLCDLIQRYGQGDSRRAHLATAVSAVELALAYEPCRE